MVFITRIDISYFMVDNFTGQVFGRYSLQAPAIVDVLLDSAPAHKYLKSPQPTYQLEKKKKKI